MPFLKYLIVQDLDSGYNDNKFNFKHRCEGSYGKDGKGSDGVCDIRLMK